MEWLGKKKHRGGFSGNTDYDVLVSVVRNSRMSADEWGGYAFALVFRNNAYRIAMSLNAKTMLRTPIKPNENRIYFIFGDEKLDGVKLSQGSDGAHFSSRFAFFNKTEMEVAKAVWVGEYDLQYDKAEQCYYIERRMSFYEQQKQRQTR